MPAANYVEVFNLTKSISKDYFEDIFRLYNENDSALNLSIYNTSDDELEHNLNHLRVFRPSILWSWTVVLCILLAVGATGNVMVITVVAKMRDLRSSTNLLLVNLAWADLMVLLVPLPTAMVELHSLPETWVLGKALCIAVPFVEWSVSHASALTILVISSERYYAICSPLKVSYKCTRMKAFSWIALIWLAAILISWPTMLLTHHRLVPYIGNRELVPICYTDMTTQGGRMYFTVMVTGLFLLPLGLILVLYIMMARQLTCRESDFLRRHREARSPSVMKARKQVIVMLATVTLFFFVCLIPFRLFSLWFIWDEENSKKMGPSSFYSILYATRLLLYVNSSINPILYSLTSSKFRSAFRRLVTSKSSQNSNRDSTWSHLGCSSIRSISSKPNILDSTNNATENRKNRESLEFTSQSPIYEIPSVQYGKTLQYGRRASFTANNQPYTSGKESAGKTNWDSIDSPNEENSGRSQGICPGKDTIVEEEYNI